MIPYDAITAFADPAVRFGLQFESLFTNEDDEEPEGMQDLGAGNDSATAQDEAGGKGEGDKGEAEKKAEQSDDTDDKGNAKVVTLDSFRKK